KATPVEGLSPLAKKQVLIVAGAALLVVVSSLTTWLLLRGDRSDTPPDQTRPTVTPASLRLEIDNQPITLEAGARRTVRVPVKVRRQYCPGPVEVRLAEPTPGITVREALIGKDSDECVLELTVDSELSSGERTVRLLAEAKAARDEGLVHLLIYRPGAVPSLKIEPPAAVTLHPGASQTINLRVKRQNCRGFVEVSLAEPQLDISLRDARGMGGTPAVPGRSGFDGPGSPGGPRPGGVGGPGDPDEVPVELSVHKDARPGVRKLRLLAVISNGGGGPPGSGAVGGEPVPGPGGPPGGAGDVRGEGTLQVNIVDTQTAARLRQRPTVLVPDDFQVAVVRGQFPILQLMPERPGGGPLPARSILVIDNAGAVGPGAPGRGPQSPAATVRTGWDLPRDLDTRLRQMPAFDAPGVRTFRGRLEEATRQQVAGGAGGRNKVKWVRLADAEGKTAALGILPAHMVIVATSFPYKQQVEEFKKKLGLSTDGAVLTEWVQGEGGKTWPSFAFDGFEVERRTVNADGSEGRWEPLDVRGDYQRFALLSARNFAPDEPAYTPVIDAGRGLVMRVPAPFGGSEQLPDPVSKLKKIRQTLDRLKESGGGAILAPPGLRDDSDPFDTIETDRPGSMGPPSGASRPFPTPGTTPGPGGAPETKQVETPITHCLLRFVDLNVEAGKTYRYQFRVRMRNPNYSPEPDKRKDTTPELARDKVLFSDEVRVPLVTVPPDQYFYALEEPNSGPKLNTWLKSVEPWRWGSSLPPDRRGTQAAVQIHRWVDSYRADPTDEKTRRPVGEWLVAARILVERGEYVRDLSYRVPVPVKPLDAFEHELDVKPKPQRNQDKHLMDVAFGDTSVLVDFEGGKVAEVVLREGIDPLGGGGRRVRLKETVRDESAVELLIMRPDGKMIARNTTHDTDDKERSERATRFTKRIQDLKNPGAGRDPFGPDSPFRD
ncbi:MAG TPA: hypothetical protein VKD72_04300, partial [Gemmataceae bacterium]|nr:hypothetical protein [Gemmataceae bacterium]